MTRLRDDWLSGENRFDRPGEAFFSARSGRMLVGVCGLNVDPHATDEGCGRLRRLYVRAHARRRGVARALTRAALERARGHFAVVRLRTFDPGASAFYGAMGFSPVSADPFVTHQWRFE